ncbi:hypothetical protein Mapa_006143 [Marchantia paleacea]|nr:hypothetical protein Mapa_006143 [Marchantia paleacea]
MPLSACRDGAPDTEAASVPKQVVTCDPSSLIWHRACPFTPYETAIFPAVPSPRARSSSHSQLRTSANTCNALAISEFGVAPTFQAMPKCAIVVICFLSVPSFFFLFAFLRGRGRGLRGLIATTGGTQDEKNAIRALAFGFCLDALVSGALLPIALHSAVANLCPHPCIDIKLVVVGVLTL